MPNMPIVVLVATMSGTAEMVADEIAAKLQERGLVARVVRMERATLAMFQQRKLFVICSSSYGTGDVPDNGQAFYQVLGKERPDLSDVRYGVFALGDMTYSATFCGGGTKLDELFASLGAQRLVSRYDQDAQSGLYPEEVALRWLDQWIDKLEAASIAYAPSSA